MKRKLIKHGPSSTIIALPIQWVRDQQLKAGDTVTVQPDGDMIIVTGHKTSVRRELTIDIDGLDQESITLIIRDAYRKGYTKIFVHHTEQATHDHQTGSSTAIQSIVKKELGKLIGFVSTEESNHLLIIQEMAVATAQELPFIYRKAFTMTQQIIVSIADDKKELSTRVSSRQDELTKIVSYAIRVIMTGKARLSNNEKLRMMHCLLLLEVLVNMLASVHYESRKRKQAFLADVILCFGEIEKVVFTKEQQSIYRFHEIKRYVSEHPLENNVPVTAVLTELVLLYAAEQSE